VKLYFSFGKRISTKKFKNDFADPDIQELIKSKVELSLMKQFKTLFEQRASDESEGKTGDNMLRRIINVVNAAPKPPKGA
jgi:hypothetical protein